MKKILLLVTLFLLSQSLVQANTFKCVENGNKITCYTNGQVTSTLRRQKMSNGLVEIEMCNVGFGGFCQYLKATPMEAQNYAQQFKNTMQIYNQYASQEIKKQKIGKATIAKEVSITTSAGKKITFQENGLGEDYIIINGQKKLLDQQIYGNRIATYKDNVKYESMAAGSGPTTFESIIANEIKFDEIRNKKRSYEEIILGSNKLSSFFKLVYRLRIEEGVSLEDAQKLMTFPMDKGYYKPENLLLTSEIQALKYKKVRSDSNEKLKNLNFPTK